MQVSWLKDNNAPIFLPGKMPVDESTAQDARLSVTETLPLQWRDRSGFSPDSLLAFSTSERT